MYVAGDTQIALDTLLGGCRLLQLVVGHQQLVVRLLKAAGRADAEEGEDDQTHEDDSGNNHRVAELRTLLFTLEFVDAEEGVHFVQLVARLGTADRVLGGNDGAQTVGCLLETSNLAHNLSTLREHLDLCRHLVTIIVEHTAAVQFERMTIVATLQVELGTVEEPRLPHIVALRRDIFLRLAECFRRLFDMA